MSSTKRGLFFALKIVKIFLKNNMYCVFFWNRSTTHLTLRLLRSHSIEQVPIGLNLETLKAK